MNSVPSIATTVSNNSGRLICALLFAGLLMLTGASNATANSEGKSQSPAAQAVPDSLPKGTTALPDLRLNNAAAFQKGKQLFFVLEKLPQDGWLNMPRICNVVERVHWLGSDDKQSLTLKPEITFWQIQLADTPADSNPVLVLELDAEPLLYKKEMVAEPGRDGTINLPAKLATTFGEKLRFEPQPHKNTVGYWTNEEDYVQWHFTSPTDAVYTVEIFQGCGKGHGGSKADLIVGDQKLSFIVEDTGHFQNFVWRKLGEVKVSADVENQLQVVPVNKAHVAIMDIRAIRLVPQND